MGTLILTLALAAACAAPTSAQSPAPAGAGSVEQEIKALDLAWHTAVAARLRRFPTLSEDDYRFELDARRMLTKAQEAEAVRVQDPLFDFGKFKLSEVSVTVEGERAVVSGILIARPSGGDKKARPRYFYTRSCARRDDRWQVVSSRLVSGGVAASDGHDFVFAGSGSTGPVAIFLDETARVTQLHNDDRHYKLLLELGTQPRTAHLVRLRNPNPALAQAPKAHEGEH
jgi:ketosteroid isomerase-like protein